MRLLWGLFISLCFWGSRSTLAIAGEEPRKPNVLLIYADDVGFGDLAIYGGNKNLPTPHLDKLAAQGIKFTNAHATSATCTPSRYALLTGKYPWRNSATSRVMNADAGAIISPAQPTVAKMLKNAGYRTAVIGKWHLGFGDGKSPLDWNGELKPGPLESGFDESFVIPATGDRVPCVYVANHRVANLDANDPLYVNYQHKIGDEPTGKENPELLTMRPSHGHNQTIVNGVSRIGWMSGGKNARWNDETMAETLTTRALDFIAAQSPHPFFLYFSPHEIHVPRITHPRFAGKSGYGARGDALLQLDDTVGKLLAKLDELGIAENTLVIFSSDNGPVVDDGYNDQAAEKLRDHRPAGDLRGAKYSAFEAGTRVPFIVRYPARVAGGKTSAALVSQVDLFATLAALSGGEIPAASDAQNQLATWLGENERGREFVIEHAANNTLSYRTAEWKYIEPSRGGATFGAGGANMGLNRPIETGYAEQPQLYAIDHDLGEQQNIAAQHPEVVKKLATALADIRHQVDDEKKISAEGIILLLPAEAQLTGDLQISMLDNSPVIGDWTNPADEATWVVTVPQTGEYALTYSVAVPSASAKRLLTLTVATQTIKNEVVKYQEGVVHLNTKFSITGRTAISYRVLLFATVNDGEKCAEQTSQITLSLSAGENTLTLKNKIKDTDEELNKHNAPFKVKSLQLTPIKKEN